MADKLTWDEIKKRFPDEWVVLVDYALDGEKFAGGVVVEHGKVKKAVYASSHGIEDCALVYTGKRRGHLVMGRYVIQDLDEETRT